MSTETSASRVLSCTPLPGRAAATPNSPSVVVAPALCTAALANLVTGYTVKAMERKIEPGDWAEGKVWRRAPEGHIMIDIQGYERWVESQ